MARKEKQYVRLPGRGMRRENFVVSAGYARLWLGRDHLLQVNRYGFAEDYRRFYFRDIQAFTVRQTNTWLGLGAGLGIPALLLALWALAVENVAGQVWLWIMAGTCGLFSLWNLLRGPTCVCHLRTAVQTEQLPSLNRLWTARRVLSRVRAAITAEQGTLTGAEIGQRLAEAPAGPEAGRVAVTAPAAGLAPPKFYDGRVHVWLFGLLLAELPVLALDYFFNHVLYAVIEGVMGFGVGILTIIALVRQAQSSLPSAVRRVTVATMVYVAISFFLGWIAYMMLYLVEGEGVMTDAQVLRRFAGLSPEENGWLMAMFVLSFAGSGVLGALGLALVQQYRRRLVAPGVPAPAPAPAMPPGG
jgi:hypothetical protein